MRFSDSSIFNGLRSLKMAMHPYIAAGITFCDTRLQGGNKTMPLALAGDFISLPDQPGPGWDLEEWNVLKSMTASKQTGGLVRYRDNL